MALTYTERSPVTVREFIDARQKELEEFVTFWNAENAKNPANFPEKMSADEWEEQFLAWYYGGVR